MDLPKKLMYEGKEISLGEYCANHCPQRYESECWVLCHLKKEREDMYEDDDYDDEEEDW